VPTRDHRAADGRQSSRAICYPLEPNRTEVNRRCAQEETPEETNVMTSPIAGGVDCDLHPAVSPLTSLLPYLNDYWRDQVTTRE